MENDLYTSVRLDAECALALLRSAGLASDGRASVRTACVHRVLILEVAQPRADAYRSAPVDEVRVLVDAVEPVQTQYLEQLDLSSLEWREDTALADDQRRIGARLAYPDLRGMRLRRWAVEDVAEIAWDSPKAAWEGLVGIASERHRIDLVGTHPARWMSRDDGIVKQARRVSDAGWWMTGIVAIAVPYAAFGMVLTPAFLPLLGATAGIAVTTTLVSAWVARRVPARMRPARSPRSRDRSHARVTSRSARAA